MLIFFSKELPLQKVPAIWQPYMMKHVRINKERVFRLLASNHNRNSLKFQLASRPNRRLDISSLRNSTLGGRRP